jgi:hypothetical protein
MTASLTALESLEHFVSSASNEELAVLLRRSGQLEASSEAESDRQRKQRQRRAERSLTLPPVEDPKRRRELEAAGCAEWLRYYRHDQFYLPFTTNQRRILDEIMYRVQYGGQKALADTRGGGKTSICEGATAFSIVRRLLRYPLIVAANGEAANEILGNIKKPFEENERLLADYPEICLPIRELAEAPQKAMGQCVNGRPTHAAWSKTTVKFPTVWLDWCPECLSANTLGEADGPFLCLDCGNDFDLWQSPSSGARVKAVGVFGKIRGKRDGAQRPDFALGDDIEDEEAAVSMKKRMKIRRVLDRALAGVAGPDKRLASVLLVTIQNPRCISAEYTDPNQRPGWSGERFCQVISWPESEEAKKLWAQYIERRQDGKRSGQDPEGRAATALYLANQEVMDAGAVIANPNRFIKDRGEDGAPLEYTAIQHIYNVAADRGWETVDCEYQNNPQDELQKSGIPKAPDIAKRKTNLSMWQVPEDAEVVSAGIDVQNDSLWWWVSALRSPIGGQCLAYGCFPDQRRRFFVAKELSPTMSEAYTQANGYEAPLDAVIYWGLKTLVAFLMMQKLKTESGREFSIGGIGIDSGSGEHDETVRRFVRECGYQKGFVLPSKGFGITAKRQPMFLWEKTEGETRGWNSRIAYPKGWSQKQLQFDTNSWKFKFHEMLSLPIGTTGAFTFWGDDRVDHRQVSEHLTAETRRLMKSEDSGRQCYEYEEMPGSPDNHWLDAGVISLARANFMGIQVSTGDASPQKKRPSALEVARKRGL